MEGPYLLTGCRIPISLISDIETLLPTHTKNQDLRLGCLATAAFSNKNYK